MIKIVQTLPDNLIKDFEKGISITQLSTMYPISRPTISKKLKELGYKTNDKFSEKDKKEIYDLYFNKKMNQTQIAQFKKCNRSSIVRLFDKENWQSRGHRKYNVNHTFFEFYNEVNCYVAGFIAADGYVHKDMFGITVAEKDEEFLRQLLELLSPNKELRKFLQQNKYPSVEFRLYSKKIVEDLKNNFGITQNKSLTYQIPEKIPDKFLPFFLLGMFDGDGSITYSINKNGYMQPQFSITGTKEVCNKFKAFFSKENLKLNKRHKDTKNNYTLFISGINNIKKIYKQLPFNKTKINLKRKQEKFEYIISRFNQ